MLIKEHKLMKKKVKMIEAGAVMMFNVNLTMIAYMVRMILMTILYSNFVQAGWNGMLLYLKRKVGMDFLNLKSGVVMILNKLVEITVIVCCIMNMLLQIRKIGNLWKRITNNYRFHGNNHQLYIGARELPNNINYAVQDLIV